MLLLINGKSSSALSVHDRAVHYGDGLFETLAIKNGRVQNWALHWRRLSEGCERLFLPQLSEIQLMSEIDHVLEGAERAVVKIIYSRGVGNRGYAFDHVEPSRMVLSYDWPNWDSSFVTQGISLFECQTQLARQPALAGLKHLNRLENVLARHEWNDKKYAEGIMSDTDNNIIEGTMSNLFVVSANTLFTPDLSASGVKGITRQNIIMLAKKSGYKTKVCRLSKKDLLNADELFVCNTLIDIWPVRYFSQKHYQTGKDHNLKDFNPITCDIQKKLKHYNECNL